MADEAAADYNPASPVSYLRAVNQCRNYFLFLVSLGRGNRIIVSLLTRLCSSVTWVTSNHAITRQIKNFLFFFSPSGSFLFVRPCCSRHLKSTRSDSACVTLRLPLKRPRCCAANSTHWGSCYANQGYNYSVSAALGAVPDQLGMQTRSCWVCRVSSLTHRML